MKKRISLGLILILILGLFTGCKQTPVDGITKTGFYLDTVITITLYCENAADEIDECFALCDKYEKLFSKTIEDSDISKINANPGEHVRVNDDTIELLQKSLNYQEISGNVFTPAIGNLSSLWDFHSDDPKLPDENNVISAKNDLTSALNSENYIDIAGNEVTLLNPNISLDLGGIAKGYIADKLKEHLNEKGITSGIINLGGNVLLLGPKDIDDGKYTLGIQNPAKDDGSVIASVKLDNQSLVTSGTYQRSFEIDGKLYHHILDVNTGYPIETDLASVTIISDSSTDGDALSTICMIKGYEDSCKLLENFENIDAIFIYTNGEIKTTFEPTKYSFHITK